MLDSIKNLKEGIIRADIDMQCIQWILFHDKSKSYAIWRQEAILENYDLSTQEQWDNLKWSEVIEKLNRLLNLGYEENKACPCDIITSVTKQDTLVTLKSRLAKLLHWDLPAEKTIVPTDNQQVQHIPAPVPEDEEAYLEKRLAEIRGRKKDGSSKKRKLEA